MQQKIAAALPRVVEIFSYPKKVSIFRLCKQQKIAAALPRVAEIFSYPKKVSIFPLYMQQKIAAALPRAGEQWKSWQLGARCTWLLQLIG